MRGSSRDLMRPARWAKTFMTFVTNKQLDNPELYDKATVFISQQTSNTQLTESNYLQISNKSNVKCGSNGYVPTFSQAYRRVHFFKILINNVQKGETIFSKTKRMVHSCYSLKI